MTACQLDYLAARDVGEAHQAETDASDLRMSRSSSWLRRTESEAYVFEMIHQSFKSKVKNKHLNEIIRYNNHH